MPTRDLNHWRSLSTTLMSAMGVSQTREARVVLSSKDFSGSVSRISYERSAASRSDSFGGFIFWNRILTYPQIALTSAERCAILFWAKDEPEHCRTPPGTKVFHAPAGDG